MQIITPFVGLFVLLAGLYCLYRCFAPNPRQRGRVPKRSVGHPPGTTPGQQSVREKLAAKNRIPWIERDRGMSLITLKNGETLRESFEMLDDYEAHASIELRAEKPLFSEGYADQHDKADALSRVLEVWLRRDLPYPFRALAGDHRVDVVRLEHYGNTAYVFIVTKRSVIVPISGQRFYYDVPRVLRELEAFIAAHPQMDPVIWLERDADIFMFVVQQKL